MIGKSKTFVSIGLVRVPCTTISLTTNCKMSDPKIYKSADKGSP
jgi:hypothetical protein